MSNNKKVTELTQVAAMNKSDVFYVVQSGTNDRYATFEDLSATVAQAQAGTSEVKFVTPYALDGYFKAVPLIVGDHGTTDGYINLATTTGDSYMQFVCEHATHNGHIDIGGGFGYNVFNKVVGDFTWAWAIEADYWDTVATHTAEMYAAYVATDGVTSVRPYQMNIDHDDYEVIHRWHGDFYYLTKSLSDDAIVTITVNSMNLADGVMLVSGENDGETWFRQYKVDGVNTCNLMFSNANDNIEIGEVTSPAYVPAKFFVGHQVATDFSGGISIVSNTGLYTRSYDESTNKPLIFSSINTDVWPYNLIVDIGLGGLPARAVTMALTEQTSEPAWKPNGTIAYADGSSWNPGGTGEGFYGMVNGSWVKL